MAEKEKAGAPVQTKTPTFGVGASTEGYNVGPYVDTTKGNKGYFLDADGKVTDASGKVYFDPSDDSVAQKVDPTEPAWEEGEKLADKAEKKSGKDEE